MSLLPISGLSIDAEETRLLNGRVICFQPRKGYRSAVDPILLQAAVPAGPGERVLELGCGAGAASLSLAFRLPDVSVSGLDFQAPLIELARQGCVANGFEDRAAFHLGDLIDPPEGLIAEGFDHVMANPPYQKSGTSRPSQNAIKAAATVEGEAKLADWVGCAVAMVRPGGTVTFIHHGARTDELIELMARNLGGLRILPIAAQPDGGGAARVLVRGVKEDSGKKQTEKPLILHRADGQYEESVDNILRGSADLCGVLE